jgi:hypothetical protein
MFLTIFLLSCNNDDFSPIKEIEKFPVTYCLLDTRAKEQIVLIQSSYLSDTTKLQIEKIKVTLIENSRVPLILRDTIIPGLANYRGYYLPGFKIKRNLYYGLTVEYNGISEYADVFVPQKTPVIITTKYSNIDDHKSLNFNASVSRSAPSTNAIRFFLDYENNNKGTIVRDTIELPIHSDVLDFTAPGFKTDYSWFEPVDLSYSNFSKGWNASYYKLSGNSCIVNLPISYWCYIFSKIREGTTIGDITIKGAFVVFYTIDNFYYDNYLLISNEEPYGVRLDAPYIPTNFKSNIERPIGYFSILTADTTKFLVDPMLIFDSFFRDGQ